MLYTFYGDDFTGSTDVLEQLALAGVRAALFLQPPTSEDLAFVPGIEALGIAGDSRSKSPAWMSAHLPAIFQRLRSFAAPITQYKICSTFDSSPAHGSIGRALELGLEAFDGPFVPIVVGAPHLKRFVSHGELFAADPSGSIRRIDLHPMSRHPITPMREPNLCRHLAMQTATAIAEIHHNDLRSSLPNTAKAFLFDTLDASDLDHIGDILLSHATVARPLFAIGSSGLTSALTYAWRSRNLIANPPPPLFTLTSCIPAARHQRLLLPGN